VSPDLDGRTALVTGSARGIGRGFLLSCARAGADVAVHYDTSETEAAATAGEARDLGVAATTVQADVTDADDVDDLFATVESELDTVDVLVNNVGAFAPVHWEALSIDRWREVIATNVDATYLCCRRAVPAMREAGWGRIVNLGYAGSEKALVDPTNTPYFIAKTGVLMFTRMLAADTTDDGITVNAVSPYVVDTSDAFPEDAPRGRWASVADLVAVLEFFLSAAASYVSGENVQVDGGYLPENV
jgi:Dehydrogenases with different specificities (related to short-chain alcohol dehydrogenases)